ncbi:MAG: PIG-L family deacetylase [Chloroflexota bacterium]|nr:MAG: PIG-L family deacetylase [Chloroflexota bacterium]
MRNHVISHHSSNLLAIFAHPDDETYRAGGTLALLAESGVSVQVLTATRGQAGSCGDPPLCIPEELANMRENELICACAALGIEPPILLDYQDGHLAEVDRETIITEILALIEDLRPQVILTFGQDGLSGHPDHIAIGEYAAEAYRLSNRVDALYTLAVPQSIADTLGMSQIHAVPDCKITLKVDVSSSWESKKKAIQCHATQLSSSPINRAPLERQLLFLGSEHFVLSSERKPHRFFSDLTGV